MGRDIWGSDDPNRVDGPDDDDMQDESGLNCERDWDEVRKDEIENRPLSALSRAELYKRLHQLALDAAVISQCAADRR